MNSCMCVRVCPCLVSMHETGKKLNRNQLDQKTVQEVNETELEYNQGFRSLLTQYFEQSKMST